MYIPKAFSSEDQALAARLVRDHPFGLLMSPGGAAEISHLPMLLCDDGGTGAKIIGHVAKANPHGDRFDGGEAAVAVFTGPHAYISPTWYTTPGMVPTWNYAAVHVHGRPIAVEGAAAADVLRRLTATFESEATDNWSVDNLPDGRLEQLLKGIVAFEMPVERIEIKLKMSQNRSAADIAGAVAALGESAREEERQTAAMMADLTAMSGA